MLAHHVNAMILEAIYCTCNKSLPIGSAPACNMSTQSHTKRCSAVCQDAQMFCNTNILLLDQSPGFIDITPEACKGLLQLLNKNILVPKQCVGIGKVWAHLSKKRNHADSLFIEILSLAWTALWKNLIAFSCSFW